MAKRKKAKTRKKPVCYQCQLHCDSCMSLKSCDKQECTTCKWFNSCFICTSLPIMEQAAFAELMTAYSELPLCDDDDDPEPFYYGEEEDEEDLEW